MNWSGVIGFLSGTAVLNAIAFFTARKSALGYSIAIEVAGLTPDEFVSATRIGAVVAFLSVAMGLLVSRIAIPDLPHGPILQLVLAIGLAGAVAVGISWLANRVGPTRGYATVLGRFQKALRQKLAPPPTGTWEIHK